MSGATDPRLSIENHKARAKYHAEVGDMIAGNDAGQEWAGVCYFYAAYHLVQAALINDPIFDEPTLLSRIHVDLSPQDRFTSRHKGRKRTSNGAEWGVNDLVLLLYKQIAGVYDRLHQASNDIRYGRGLRSGVQVEQLRGFLLQIQNEFAAGNLVARLPA